MAGWRALRAGLGRLLRRRRAEQDLDDEVRHFMQEAAGAGRERGLDAARLREQVRSYGWENAVEALGADLRLAARQLRRRPGYALAAIGVLALGLGVATAMFSVLGATLFQPLPFAHSDRLVTAAEPRGPVAIFWGVSHPDVLDWRRDSHTLTAIAYCEFGQATLEGATASENLNTPLLSANLFAVLGVAPRLGRTFEPQDVAGRAPLVVLSDALWRRWFHGRADIIGRAVKLSGANYTVIGVMPAGFVFPLQDPGDLWRLYLPSAPDDRSAASLQVIARLRPGVSPRAAQSELSGIQGRLARRYGSLKLPGRVVVTGYRDSLFGPMRPALGALLLAVGLIWLIACASVAGLQLTRASERRRELAVRAALGASRGRLARGLLCESAWLGVASGAAGAGVGALIVRLLRPFVTAHVLISGPGALALSPAVLAALAAATLASVLVVGLLPALGAASGVTLNARAHGATRAQQRGRDALVVAELALALLLVAGAGLLLRTLYNLQRAPLGFTTANVLTARLQIPSDRFARQSIATSLERPLLARLEALPGVRAAAVSSVVPLAAGVEVKGMFGIVGEPQLHLDQEPQGDLRFTSPGYPRVFGIPLLRGRFFEASRDTPATPTVVVINQALARRYFAGQNPVGRQFSVGRHRTATIIGVLADVHGTKVGAPATPTIHFSTTQLAPGSPFYNLGLQFVQLAVRSAGPDAALGGHIRRLLHALAPEVAAGNFQSERELVAASLGDQVFAARLLGLFGLAALAVALAGLYGLLAHSVALRRHELAVRQALGASQGQIRSLVLGRAARLVGWGVGLGLVGALLLTRLLRAWLYGVAVRDPLTLTGAVALLAATALLAAWLPARRAAAVPPASALQSD